MVVVVVVVVVVAAAAAAVVVVLLLLFTAPLCVCEMRIVVCVLHWNLDW